MGMFFRCDVFVACVIRRRCTHVMCCVVGNRVVIVLIVHWLVVDCWLSRCSLFVVVYCM